MNPLACTSEDAMQERVEKHPEAFFSKRNLRVQLCMGSEGGPISGLHSRLQVPLDIASTLY